MVAIDYNEFSVAAEQRPQELQFDLSGGHLALDFANSISRRDSPEKSVEHVHSYHDLISFALQSNIVAAKEAGALVHQADAQPRSVAQTLRKALALRETLFRVFAQAAGGNPAAAEDLALLEQAATEALSRRHLVRISGAYRWEWDTGPTLERILWPIVTSAAELLVSDNVGKIRECEAGDCYWLFLDNSRNRSRRWCSMSSCGNREKARRHYHKQRQH